MKYAEWIQYDERILMERFSELYALALTRWCGETTSTTDHLNRIWKEIVGLCTEHGGARDGGGPTL